MYQNISNNDHNKEHKRRTSQPISQNNTSCIPNQYYTKTCNSSDQIDRILKMSQHSKRSREGMAGTRPVTAPSDNLIEQSSPQMRRNGHGLGQGIGQGLGQGNFGNIPLYHQMSSKEQTLQNLRDLNFINQNLNLHTRERNDSLPRITPLGNIYCPQISSAPRNGEIDWAEHLTAIEKSGKRRMKRLSDKRRVRGGKRFLLGGIIEKNLKKL